MYPQIVVYSTGSREVPSKESLKDLPSLTLSADISKISKVSLTDKVSLRHLLRDLRRGAILRRPLKDLRKDVIYFLKDPEKIMEF